MSLYKTFKPTGRLDVQFRAEASGIFNHTQSSLLNSWVDTETTPDRSAKDHTGRRTILRKLHGEFHCSLAQLERPGSRT